jgi:hypothetical protein
MRLKDYFVLFGSLITLNSHAWRSTITHRELFRIPDSAREYLIQSWFSVLLIKRKLINTSWQRFRVYNIFVTDDDEVSSLYAGRKEKGSVDRNTSVEFFVLAYLGEKCWIKDGQTRLQALKLPRGRCFPLDCGGFEICLKERVSMVKGFRSRLNLKVATFRWDGTLSLPVANEPF